ncbi:cupin [Hansschlegelia quercus]|uniref:Cupin n=1 Tax=Hansschlegelia quercus TaxID=2528245 RepID=A0A4Q9GKK4_9HYPH|nr:cupin [Hansschlegelia quercus]TBN54823.1 cupin [Hansschlegelia quercus]
MTDALLLSDDGETPNNPRLPLLVHHRAFNASVPQPAVMAESLFGANGWGGFWRNGIYPFHHYHSTCHEALAIGRGWVEVRFGGESGETVRLEAGDVAVLPAGTGHKRVVASDDLLVIGAYPPDQPLDLIRPEEGGREEAIARIAEVPTPATDPVYGTEGGLKLRWANA